MSNIEEEIPDVIVSQSEQREQEPNHVYSDSKFVLVHGSTTHLWVNGIHFIEDGDGAVQEGQYFLMKDPGMGVMVSEITSVQEDGSVDVRHRFHWYDGELAVPNSTETWRETEITGKFDRSMGDASQTVFLRQE